MYSIILVKPNMKLEMPNDKNLSLSEVCFRIEIYKRKNPSAYFFVRDNNGNEFEI